MKQEIIALAQDLIRRPSMSPQDLGCQEVIAQRLEKLGFSIEWMQFNDTLNFWATRGSGSPCIAFAGHTDVVPVGDVQAWHYSPFSATVVDDRLYGRGAADMKGSLASMVVAVEHFVKANPNHAGKIAFLITSDEEAAAKDGTVKVVEALMARGETIDYCLVGEPSSTQFVGDVIKNGRRGSITANLYIEGVQGHVAYPHLADNPVHKSLKMLDELVAVEWDQGNEFFPPTSLQIANIQAGTGSNNVIPGELFVQFNLRFSPEVSDSKIKEKVKQLLEKYQLKYRIDWHLSGHPFMTPVGKFINTVQSAVSHMTGNQARLDTGGGTSDGRFIALMGAQVVELGPLNATIHKVNECVSCEDLYILSKIHYHWLTLILQK